MKYHNIFYLLKKKVESGWLRKAALQLLGAVCLSSGFLFMHHKLNEHEKVEPYDFASKRSEMMDETVAEVKSRSQMKTKSDKSSKEGKRSPGDDNTREANTSTKQVIEDKININSADKATLMLLPHVGAKKADDIIAYRSAFGFTAVEDLMEVKGIGEKTFAKLVDLITV